MSPYWMLSFMRVFSGVFMVIMGVGFCLEARLFESMLLKGSLFFIGTGLVLLGGFVLIGKKKKREDEGPEEDSSQVQPDVEERHAE
jgi:hypothetical protein